VWQAQTAGARIKNYNLTNVDNKNLIKIILPAVAFTPICVMKRHLMGAFSREENCEGVWMQAEGAECGKPLTVICLMKLLLGSMVVVVVAAVVAAASVVVSRVLVVAAVESPVAGVPAAEVAPAAKDAALVGAARSPAPVVVPEVEDVASTSATS